MKMVVMAALFALLCAGGAVDIGSLVAQLDGPLMKKIIGSMQSQIEIEGRTRMRSWLSSSVKINHSEVEPDLYTKRWIRENFRRILITLSIFLFRA